MSMSSIPKEMNANEMMKSMDAMTDWTKGADFTVAPLMVYPLGAAAAATAVGFGIAGQMTGLMLGAMQGALQSQSALFGSKPDLSWMIPTLAEDLAPNEPGVDGAATGRQASDPANSAEIVTLKPAAKASDAGLGVAPDAVKAKPATAKPARTKVARSAPGAKAEAASPAKPVAQAENAAGAAVAKLKSDAEVAAAAVSETITVAKPAVNAPAKALEPEDFHRPAEMEKPETPDDLKLISGVGPKLEQVLNGLGVWTFSQVADWKAEEIAWVEDYLQFKGRVERDDWTSQARALARGGAKDE